MFWGRMPGNPLVGSSSTCLPSELTAMYVMFLANASAAAMVSGQILHEHLAQPGRRLLDPFDIDAGQCFPVSSTARPRLDREAATIRRTWTG